jgi:hypothetical protein
MNACVIMHNMIVEDERNERIHDQGWEFQVEFVALYSETATFEEFLHVHVKICDRTIYDQLQKDLIEYQWRLAEMEENE